MVKCITALVIFISWVFVLTNQAWAHAEKAFYLKGKLAKQEIVVKMLCYDETPAIRYIQYFFTTDKRDRYMAGKLVNGFWHFAAAVQNVKSNPQPDGMLTIAPNGTTWQGDWVDYQGRKQPVILQPIPPDFTPLPFGHLPLIKEMDPYERYRLANLRFIKTTTERYKGELVSNWYLEKESGISFFRLGSGNKKVSTVNVNATLEAMHLSLVQQYFAYSPERTDAVPKTKLLYLSTELISFRVATVSHFLTLAHSQVLLSATLDVATGQTLKPEDVFWLDKTAAKPAAGDFFALYQYRKKLFAPQVFQWLQALYPQQTKSERCGVNKAENWNLPAWNLTVKGLALGINNADDCNTFQWAIIPYDKLQPFTDKKYHLPKGK